MLIVHSASPFMETISATQMQGNIPSYIIHTSIIYEKSEDADGPLNPTFFKLK